MDKRWTQLAELIAGYSCEIARSEKVSIMMMETHTYPLLTALHAEIVKRGAYPQVLFNSERLKHSLLRYGNKEQIGWVPELEAYGMEWADVHIALRGTNNSNELWDIPAEKSILEKKAAGTISKMRWEDTRWIIVRVPEECFAMGAGTDFETMQNMFFDACLKPDWPLFADQYASLARRFEEAELIKIKGEKTDLRFSIRGRRWIVGTGKINLPDGELFTAPIVETVEGTFQTEMPASYAGRVFQGLSFTWEKGKLVDFSTPNDQDHLEHIVSVDEGAEKIGEFAFGLNPYITRVCRDIFFDEKIGGSIHVALGRSYPEAGGKNMSAIHWDIVKDMHENGEVYADDKLIYADGKFIG